MRVFFFGVNLALRCFRAGGIINGVDAIDAGRDREVSCSAAYFANSDPRVFKKSWKKSVQNPGCWGGGCHTITGRTTTMRRRGGCGKVWCAEK
jgi:hypothetical protein